MCHQEKNSYKFIMKSNNPATSLLSSNPLCCFSLSAGAVFKLRARHLLILLSRYRSPISLVSCLQIVTLHALLSSNPLRSFSLSAGAVFKLRARHLLILLSRYRSPISLVSCLQIVIKIEEPENMQAYFRVLLFL